MESHQLHMGNHNEPNHRLGRPCMLHKQPLPMYPLCPLIFNTAQCSGSIRTLTLVLIQAIPKCKLEAQERGQSLTAKVATAASIRHMYSKIVHECKLTCTLTYMYLYTHKLIVCI
jgi:hypothetical protein